MNTVGRSTVRKSLPLSERDVGDLGLLRGSEVHRAALSRLIGAEVTNASEAALLHAVVVAGFRAVHQQVEDQGYAQIAAEMETSNQRVVARRRRPSWADE